jgi:hypothetical protein
MYVMCIVSLIFIIVVMHFRFTIATNFWGVSTLHKSKLRKKLAIIFENASNEFDETSVI